MNPSELAESLWAVIEPLLPAAQARRRSTRVPDRNVQVGIVWVPESRS